MLEDEPTTIVAAEHALPGHDEEEEPTTILVAPAAVHAMLEDEPTTIVAAEHALLGHEGEEDEPTSIVVAPGAHAMLEDEPTTIVAGGAVQDAGGEHDEADGPDGLLAAGGAAVPVADGSWEDTAERRAGEAAGPLPHGAAPGAAYAVWPGDAPGAGVAMAEPGEPTEIRLAPGQGRTSEAGEPRGWFDARLQDFTTALQQDEAGRPRPPQERQMLAATARDMIARVAISRTGGAEGWEADTVLQPDQLLANTYIVRSLIARGGVGEIYRTRHRDLKTEHAVKILLPRYALDATLLTMMLDEARLLQCVRHEAVVGCQDLLRDADGRPMIVMDYLRGRTLSSRLREGRLPLPDLLALARRLADGLSAIHAAGIVHQDISPDNVILAEDSCAAATIIDFGLARSIGSLHDMHRNLDFAGKFSWSSPEQLSGRVTAVDGRSDLYSLGLMLAAAARGYRLDMGTDLESARAARTTVPSLAGIEEPVAGLLTVLLAPSPSARLSSAAEIHAMLEPRPPTFWQRLQGLFTR